MIETRLLLRQIAKAGASVERPPDERGWLDFLMACDDDGLRDLLSVFFVDAERSLSEVAVATRNGDIAGLSRLAHRLKSGSAYLGAVALQQLCVDIEQAAHRSDAFWALHLTAHLGPGVEAFRKAIAARGLLSTAASA